MERPIASGFCDHYWLRLLALAIVAAVIAVLSLPFVIRAEHQRVSSPDGRFHAVATYPIWQRYVGMMPGSSGDKYGSITLYTQSGRRCGSVHVCPWSPSSTISHGAPEKPRFALWLTGISMLAPSAACTDELLRQPQQPRRVPAG